MSAKYKAIALDMDGTALNDQKEMDSRTREAIHTAICAGKEVLFCTGRPYDEMREFLKDFPDMHYLCGESGALVYDLRAKKPLACLTMDKQAVQLILDEIKNQDIMPCFFSAGSGYVSREQLNRANYYQIGVYQESVRKSYHLVDDIYDTMEKKADSIEKLLLFHTSPDERQKTLDNFTTKALSSTMVFSEISCLECSPLGVNKAEGLKILCEKMGISMEQMIMVGDSYNDLEALKASGLAVAMGNANAEVKSVCSATVADNNHSGCAEAIYRYLLKSPLPDAHIQS